MLLSVSVYFIQNTSLETLFSMCPPKFTTSERDKTSDRTVSVATNINTQRLVFSPLALQPNSGLGRLHETLRFTSVGRIPWTGDQLVARPPPVRKHRKTHTQHKH
jgi:hypothetical protein